VVEHDFRNREQEKLGGRRDASTTLEIVPNEQSWRLGSGD
jgi:hypothetical protein